MARSRSRSCAEASALLVLCWGVAVRAAIASPRGTLEGDSTVALAVTKDHVDRGAAAFTVGRYDEAVDAFALAYALHPAPLLLFNLGQAHRKAGRDREALALYLRFLQEEPRGPLQRETEQYLSEVRSHLRVGRSGGPRDDGGAALQAEAIARGTAAFTAGRLMEAAAQFAAAYALDPQPLLLFNLGQAHRKAGRDREALALYLRFLNAEPGTELRAETEGYLAEVRGRLSQHTPPTRSRPLSVREERPPLWTMLRPSRDRPLSIVKWVAAAAGLTGVIVGATLWGLDGHQFCPKADVGRCARELDGQTPGAVLVVSGSLVVGAAAIMFGFDHWRAGRRSVRFLLTGGFSDDRR